MTLYKKIKINFEKWMKLDLLATRKKKKFTKIELSFGIWAVEKHMVDEWTAQAYYAGFIAGRKSKKFKIKK